MFPCTLMLTVSFCPVRNYQKLKYQPKIGPSGHPMNHTGTIIPVNTLSADW